MNDLLSEAVDLLEHAMGYVRTFGTTGSVPVVVDRRALDDASDELLRRYDEFKRTLEEQTNAS